MRRAHLLIQQIVGVYRFDGGIRGGLGHLAGELRGDHACALRALTHRGLRVNPEWSAMLADFAVPIVLTHLAWRPAGLAVRRSPAPVRAGEVSGRPGRAARAGGPRRGSTGTWTGSWRSCVGPPVARG